MLLSTIQSSPFQLQNRKDIFVNFKLGIANVINVNASNTLCSTMLDDITVSKQSKTLPTQYLYENETNSFLLLCYFTLYTVRASFYSFLIDKWNPRRFIGIYGT